MKKFLAFIIFFFTVWILANSQTSDFVLPDSLAVQLQNNKNHDVKRMELLECVIDILFNELQYKESYTYIKELEVLSESLNNDYFSTISKYYLGSCFCANSDFKNGFSKLNEALNNVEKLPQNIDNQRLNVRIHLALSACYINCNMLTEAYNSLRDGISINENIGDKDLQIKMDNNLAALYSMLGKYDESTNIYKKMLHEPALFSRGYFYCNYNIANNFINDNQPDSALYYLDFLRYDIDYQDENLLVRKKKGDAYQLKNELENAKIQYEDVISEIDNDTLKYIQLYSSVSNTYAQVLYKINKNNEALEWINRSIRVIERLGDLRLKVSALKLKSRILERMKKTDDALSLLNEMLVLQDSVNEIQNKENVNSLILKQEITMLEKEYDYKQYVAQLEHSREKMKLLTVIIVLIGIVIIVFLLWNRKRILLKDKKIQEESLKFELETKNRELASNVVSLMKKNETFSEIIEKLENISASAVKDETKNALSKVIKEIEGTIEGNFWKEFELRFKEVHSDFYDRLISQYPNLTNNEIRLCAFLKMNLSTKDICSITGNSLRSVDKARERLRDKLGISKNKSISLVSFIQKL